MIEAEPQIAERLWEFGRMERQYRTVGEQAMQRTNDLLRFIEERKSRQRSLPKVRPTDRAAYVQRACDVVLALDQLTPRSRYEQAGALYAANALSGEALRALADEGSVSLENFQELFDLAGEALRLYEEVTFTRPVAGPAVELYLELAAIWAASDGWQYSEFVEEFADTANPESDLTRWQKYLPPVRVAPLAARMRVLFLAEMLRRAGGDEEAWSRAQENYEQAGNDIEAAVDAASDQEIADGWDVLLDRVRADGEAQTVALTPFAVDMVLAQAYDGFEPEPDGPPATSEALVRLLNTQDIGNDLPGDLWLGEREARINEAYRQRRQEEELEAYLEHGRISVEQALSLAPSIDAVRRRIRACRSLRFLALTVSSLGLRARSMHPSVQPRGIHPLMAPLSLEELEAIGGDSVRFFSLEVQAQNRQQRVVPDFLIGGLEKAIFVWLELRARRQAQTETIPVKEFTAAASDELERLLLRPLVGEEDFVTLHGHVYYVVQVAEHGSTAGHGQLDKFLSTPGTLEPLRAYHARGSGEWNERVRRLLAALARHETPTVPRSIVDGPPPPPLRTSELKRRRRFQRTP